MDEVRRNRVQEQLRQLVGQFLIRDFKQPLKGFVSISRVEASKDMKNAKIFVSVFGDNKERDISMQILNDYVGVFQRHINKEMTMKFCPKIQFLYDHGFENAHLVHQRLEEINQQDQIS